MTWVGWVLVGLAAGFVLLAAYGKYRTIRADFEEAREREALQREADARRAEGDYGPGDAP
jgi:hypothetical protein